LEIISTADLPKWFKIKNYDALVQLDDKQLLEQFRYRFYLRDYLGDNYGELNDDLVWSSIVNGSAIVPTETALGNTPATFYFHHDLPTPRITGSNAIHGIDFEFMMNLPTILEHRGIVSISKTEYGEEHGYKYESNLERNAEINNIAKDTGILDECAWVAVNLGKYSNIELIEIFQKLLPLWRVELNINEPKSNIGKTSEIRKISAYKIIPYMDLLFWSEYRQAKLPNNVAVVALFPQGETGEIRFSQVILPFFNKIIDENYRWLKESENVF
jgi:hypothetical protein